MLSKRITYRKRKVYSKAFDTKWAEFWVETWWLLGVVPVFRRESLIRSQV